VTATKRKHRAMTCKTDRVTELKRRGRSAGKKIGLEKIFVLRKFKQRQAMGQEGKRTTSHTPPPHLIPSLLLSVVIIRIHHPFSPDKKNTPPPPPPPTFRSVKVFDISFNIKVLHKVRYIIVIFFRSTSVRWSLLTLLDRLVRLCEFA